MVAELATRLSFRSDTRFKFRFDTGFKQIDSKLQNMMNFMYEFVNTY